MNKSKQSWIKRNPWIKHLSELRRRCNKPNRHDYCSYGAKGIKALITVKEIKELWFRDKAYLMKKPSIDRKNSKGNYTFDNCQFIEFEINALKANIQKQKKVVQLDLGERIINIWESVREARRVYGDGVTHCLSGKHKTCKGFIWRYK